MGKTEKDSFYFSHDYNARNDEKILELRANFGAEGYGLFWMILESMAETSDGKLNLSLIGGLSLGYGVAKDTLKQVVDFCLNVGLFEQDLQFFSSKRMQEHKAFRKVCSMSGKKGAEKRWGKIGGLKGGYGDPNSKGKERKGKEIREKCLENEIWLEQTAMAYKSKPHTLQKFCEDWIQKAISRGVFDKYESIAIIRFMLEDFENRKPTAEAREKKPHWFNTYEEYLQYCKKENITPLPDERN